MALSRIIGIVLLILGVVVLLFGFQSSESVADQATEAVTGRYTETTMWYLIGGLALCVLGGLMALFAPRLPKD